MMNNKEKILENVEQYSVSQLLGYIQDGIITKEDLYDNEPPLSSSIRKELEKLLTDSEQNDWNVAIKSEKVELYQKYLEVYPEGKHRQDAKIAIRNLQENAEKEQENKQNQADNDVWNNVNKKDVDSLEKFIEDYPNSIYVEKAKNALDDLNNATYTQRYGMGPLKGDILSALTDKSIGDPNKRILELIEEAFNNNLIELDDLLDEIEDDNNFLNAWVIQELVKRHRFSYGDLEDLGINHLFIEKMARSNIQRTRFTEPEQLTEISRKKTTEVYFWGIPSSGKSCALGAILSAAGDGQIATTMTPECDCQGFDYMSRLPQCFKKGEVCILPEGTPIMSTYEMGFDLTDNKDIVHPITCVDFAGELIKCIYNKYAKKNPTNQERKALDTLTNVLVSNRTSNRKMHFFVVEYGAENRMYEGLSQNEYLATTLQYIDKTDIFRTSTDAIYLIVTKVDKLKIKEGEDKSAKLVEYVRNYYGSFYNGLKQICKKYQINGGEVSVLPFSLGNVCFQNYCMFNDEYAKSIVSLIMQRSDGHHIGKRGFFDSILRG